MISDLGRYFSGRPAHGSQDFGTCPAALINLAFHDVGRNTFEPQRQHNPDNRFGRLAGQRDGPAQEVGLEEGNLSQLTKPDETPRSSSVRLLYRNCLGGACFIRWDEVANVEFD